MSHLNRVPPANPMSLTVSALAVWVEPANPEDSIQSVAREMASLGLSVLPIAQNHKFVGAVSERILKAAIASGSDMTNSVSYIMDKTAPTVLSTALGSEAMRMFSDNGIEWAIVVDQINEPLGVITPSRLISHVHSREYQGRIGGMATPFGVYLTNGVISSGASRWALVATGAVMSTLFHLAGTLVLVVQNSLPLSIQVTPAFGTFAEFALMGLFLLGIRIIPLAGTHGAEHMVVHAIERGEDLTPEIVARMPRVHPRCGTNLFVGAMIFLSIMSATAIKDTEMRLLLATLTTFIFWQPLGSMMQQFVTTKPPNRAQIDDGIRAGNQFFERANLATITRPTIVSRLIMSGLFQVMVGGTVVALLFALLYEVLKVPIQWRVSS